MGSDVRPEATEAPAPDINGPGKRFARRKRKHLIIALVVIAVALVVVFWGWSSTGRDFVDVASVVEEAQISGRVPEQYVGSTVEVRGVISYWDGSVSDREFRLYDDGQGTTFIDVTFAGVFPEGFNNSKSAVVKGQFENTLPLRLVATDISIGCSSKY